MSNLFEILEKKFDRSSFPDLEAAEKAVSLETLITPGKPSAKIAADEQDKLESQLATDFCSFHLSLGTATANAAENSCVDKHQHDKVDTQLGAWQAKNTPQQQRQPTKPFRAGKKLPRPTSITPGGSRPQSLAYTNINHGATSARPQTYYVPTIKPEIDSEKQNRVTEKFIKAQAGNRGQSVGDAAIVFGQNGTPYLGSSYLDRSNLANQSANLATSTPPVLEPPAAIKPKVVSNGKMPRADSGQIAPQSNTMGNLAALAGIALVITGIMFALQYVISTVAFIMNIQNLLVTCNNIAGSFSALFNTIGSLLGLGEDISKPLDDVIGGLLNSAFGKEKVDYVKYQWGKVSSALSAAGNVLNGLRGASSALGNAIEQGANNTSKIGNALTAMGFLDKSIGRFEENISAKQGSSKLVNVDKALQVGATTSASLTQAVADVKSGREELEQIDKDYEAKQKEIEEGKEKADKKYSPESTEATPNFKPGDY
jgi:hypothetical protein